MAADLVFLWEESWNVWHFKAQQTFCNCKTSKAVPWEGRRGPSMGQVFSGCQPGLALVVTLHPALCAGVRVQGGHPERTEAAVSSFDETRKPGYVGPWAAFMGWQLCCAKCVCCLANWFLVLASYKRSRRRSCRGSQCPQGPLSWPLRANHCCCGVRALLSLCASVCVTVYMWLSIYLSVWQRHRDAHGKFPLAKNAPGVFLATWLAPGRPRLGCCHCHFLILLPPAWFIYNSTGVRNVRLLKSSVWDLTFFRNKAFERKEEPGRG